MTDHADKAGASATAAPTPDASPMRDRRRVLQAALAAGPVILTLKSGPARAQTTSAMASATHASHSP